MKISKGMEKAMLAWRDEMLKQGEYLPPIWPTEDIMEWGKRMEAEKKKYDLTDNEWMTVETKKTEMCLQHGRSPIAKGAIKCPKYHTYKFYGPGGLSRWHCYVSHPMDELRYSCTVTGGYPGCDESYILKSKYDAQMKIRRD